MGFKPMRYFQNLQNPSEVTESTLDVKIMKRKGWKEITLNQYNRIRYS
jgi:hypothetical protein